MFAIKQYRNEALGIVATVLFTGRGGIKPYVYARDLQNALRLTNISRPLSLCRGEHAQFGYLRNLAGVKARTFTTIGANAAFITMNGVEKFCRYGSAHVDHAATVDWFTVTLPELIAADLKLSPNIPGVQTADDGDMGKLTRAAMQELLVAMRSDMNALSNRVQFLEAELSRHKNILRQALALIQTNSLIR